MYFFPREKWRLKNASSCYIFVFKSPALCRAQSRFHCSRGGYPSESLAKANSRRKVISVYGARLISYRSRIFITATRRAARARTCVCARDTPHGCSTRGCGREIEYDRKGGKTQWPRYFAEGLNHAGAESMDA